MGTRYTELRLANYPTAKKLRQISLSLDLIGPVYRVEARNDSGPETHGPGPQSSYSSGNISLYIMPSMRGSKVEIAGT